MYAALLDEQLIMARDALDEQNSAQLMFLCPNCLEPVQLVNAGRAGPYFRHPNTTFRTEETQEHQLGKKVLASGLTALGVENMLEVPLVSDQIRADVYVTHAGHAYGLEIQCAPLGTTEYSIRHDFYLSENITDIWLIGRRHFLRKKIKQIHLDLLRTNSRWGNYLLEIDVNAHHLRLKYNIQQDDLNLNCRYQTQIFALDEKGIMQLIKFRPVQLAIYRYDYVSARNYVVRQVRQKTNIGLALAQFCYERNLAPLELPLSLFVGYRDPGKSVLLLDKIVQLPIKKVG